MKYNESRIMLNQIRESYSCAGDIIFRTALLSIIQRGIEYFECANNNENGLSADVIDCAKEISEIPAIHILWYIQRENIWLGGGE